MSFSLPVQTPPLLPVLGATTLLLALGILALHHGGAQLGTLAFVGIFAGFALYHAGFGFTAAWRHFITERKSAGLRAQCVMLGLACVVFFPLIASGSAFGHPVGGFIFPIGVSLITGAFIFGIGMQLGNGCGSGTLFTIGGGSTRMLVTLAFFILGSTLATAYSVHWLAWPALPAVSIITSLGVWPALLLMLGGFMLIAILVRRTELARHGKLISIFEPQTHWIRGPWALVAGAVALAGVNIATLILSGWPWGVTSAFALWGSKIAMLVGFSPSHWAYWQGQDNALTASIFTDPTSIMDFGIILGALLAAILAGKFNPALTIPLRSLLAAAIGGLLLGIGARLGTGCNIGAFFSGIASGSLHGWVWLLAAFAGNMIGVKLRPLFRLG